MAAVTRENPLGIDKHEEFVSRREELTRRADHAIELVRKVIENDFEAIPTLPWGDRDFQQAVIVTLRNMKSLREQANELRIVKKVFRGES